MLLFLAADTQILSVVFSLPESLFGWLSLPLNALCLRIDFHVKNHFNTVENIFPKQITVQMVRVEVCTVGTLPAPAELAQIVSVLFGWILIFI